MCCVCSVDVGVYIVGVKVYVVGGDGIYCGQQVYIVGIYCG